jgi:hypothetical protein
VTTFYDTSGSASRTMIVLIGYTQSYTNESTGETLSTPLAGPAVIEPHGDGKTAAHCLLDHARRQAGPRSLARDDSR